jgi:hypothetical protein
MDEMKLMMLQSVGNTLSSPRQWADLAKNGLENTTQVGLVAGAIEQCALATCNKTNVTLAVIPGLGDLSEELQLSKNSLKHIAQHVSEFSALDKSLGLKEVTKLGQDIIGGGGIQIRPNAWEKVVTIGGSEVRVRAAVNSLGKLRTVFIVR